MDGCNSPSHSLFSTRHGRNGSQLSESSSFIHPSSKPVISSTLHFDYHSRYSPPFAHVSPSSPVRDHHRRGGSSPPPTLHHTNGSSSSAASLSMITLPPLSTLAHPHSSITQRNHLDQGSLRRHTLDSGYVPDSQMVSDGRKKTLSGLPSPHLRGKNHHSTGTEQVPPQSLAPQPGQSKLTSRRYSSPPPPQTSRRDNPPPLAMSPGPKSPSMSQPLQISQGSQPAATDAPLPITITSIDDAADVALEPLRLGFENVWTQTVQNVRQVMGKMQKDLFRLNTAERRRNVDLMRCLVSNSEKLKGQERAMDELRKENSSLMEKALENEQLRRENKQKRAMMNTLNQENHTLRRENEELRKKNEEVKEALTRAAEFIFQCKEELVKVKADAETFRKCREASEPTVPASELQREIARLDAEKERERIFNDAVKQLRALTALDTSLSIKARSGSPLSVYTIDAMTALNKARSSPLPDDEQLTPPSLTEEKCKVEDQMDDHDVIIVPPTTAVKRQQEPQSDLEMQRQRQRQARRGPTPSSSPQARSRKTSPVVSKTGVKRDREEYEEGQVDEEGNDHDVELGIQQNPKGSPVHGSISKADADNSEEMDDPEDRHVIPQTEIKIPLLCSTAKGPNAKAPGKRFNPSTRSFVTKQQQYQPPPSPQPQSRLPKKLGINHMDLLYKTEKEVMVCRICLSLEQNLDATTAERRKFRANTQKFPLNASWADLINHCQTEHTKACEDMEKLSPSQLAEMKQRTR